MRRRCQFVMKILLLAVALALAACASHPAGSLESQADTLHTFDMEAAIKAAKPGQPRCDEACREATRTVPPG